MNRTSLVLFAAAVALTPATGLGQGIAKAASPNLPAGPQNLFTETIGAWDLGPGSSGQLTGGVIDGGDYLRACASGACTLIGSLHLPSGAILDSIELDVCDQDPVNDISMTLFDCADGNGPGPCTPLDNFSTSGTPGCVFLLGPTLNTVIVNYTHDYLVDVDLPADGVTAGLRAVRAYYRLQVSPPPATPTFNDVPATDPAFQFIEAFAAAGITAGCSADPPLYCPNAT